MKICHIAAADLTLESRNRFADLVFALSEIGVGQTVIMGADESLEAAFTQKSVPCHLLKFGGLFDLRPQQTANNIISRFEPHIIQTHTRGAATIASRILHPAAQVGFADGKGVAPEHCICLMTSYHDAAGDDCLLPVPALIYDYGQKQGVPPGKILRTGAILDLGRAYRLDTIFKAMREIGDMRFTIMGEGPQRKNLEQAARRQAVHDRVFFAEPAMPAADFFADLDLCLVPLLQTEGIDRLTLEAWSRGIAVLSGMPPDRSPVRHGETGWLAENDDVLAWRAHLKTIIADRELLRSIGNAGQAQYRKAHAAGRVIAAYLHAYETALRAKS